MRKKGYIFTDKKNPKKGIMSLVLGLISVISICVAIYLTCQNNGIALMQYGAAVILSVIYSVTGIVLAILSFKEEEIFKLFPTIGLIFCIIGLAAGVTIFIV